MSKKEIKSDNKFTQLKDKLIAVATAQADRIIDAAIKKEETAKAWAERKAAVIKAAKDKAKDAAKAKRARKLEKQKEINSTIPTKEKLKKRLAEVIKNQEAAAKKIAEAHIAKDFETKQERKEKRAKKAEEKVKETIQRAHHKVKVKEKLEKTRATKEQRIQKAKEAKAEGWKKYAAEQKRIASEKLADPDGTNAKAQKRLEMLAERRLNREKRKTVQSLNQKTEQAVNLLRFRRSEAARIERKKTKEAFYLNKRYSYYLAKGGDPIPKVKNKVAVHPTSESFAKTSNKTEELVKYLFAVQRVNKVDSSCALTCHPTDLLKRIKEMHNREMDAKIKTSDPDTYVGIFVKDPKDANKYIMEIINDKFYTMGA